MSYLRNLAALVKVLKHVMNFADGNKLEIHSQHSTMQPSFVLENVVKIW